MRQLKFGELFSYLKKSKIKAGDGLELAQGKYPFFTSSSRLTKSINIWQEEKPSLIFGTGGEASVHHADDKFSVSTDCLVAQPNEEYELYVKFVYYYLSGNIRILEDGFKGAGLKHISRRYIDEIKIPLPSLETQKQIAQTLDNAAALRDKTQQLLAEYNQLAESIFLDMFGDPVLNKKSWKIKKVQDISEIVTKGSSPKWQGFGYIDKGVRFVTSENVRMGYLDCSQDKFVALDFHKKLRKSQLKQNDLLVNLVGASIGRGALVTSEILPANINQAVAKIEPRQDLVNHLFLLHLVITKQMQDRLIGNKVEGARANISLTNVRELEIIYPPMKLQNQFAEKIALIEQQKDLAKKELQESEDLFQALLQKAFRPAEEHDKSELV